MYQLFCDLVADFFIRSAKNNQNQYQLINIYLLQENELQASGNDCIDK